MMLQKLHCDYTIHLKELLVK